MYTSIMHQSFQELFFNFCITEIEEQTGHLETANKSYGNERLQFPYLVLKKACLIQFKAESEFCFKRLMMVKIL